METSLLLTIYVVLFNVKSAFAIKAFYIDRVFNIWKIPLSFGIKNSEYFYFRINLQSSELTTTLNKDIFYNITDDLDLLLNNKTIKAHIINEDVFGENVQFPLKFYILEQYDTSNEYLKGFPFGYQIYNKEFSPIYQFKQKYPNERMMFGFHIDSNHHSSMYLGELPSKLTKGKHKAICSINKEKNPHWGCFLSKVYITDMNGKINDNFNIEVNQFVPFQTYNRLIMVPRWFMDKIRSNYYSNYLDICSFVERFGNMYYSCKNEDKLFNGFITFQFENTLYKIPLKKIYEFYGNENKFCNLLIQTSNDKWEFGSLFLEQFVTQFNYEDSTVEFYSENPFEVVSNKRNSIMKMILYISIGNNIISIIILLIVRKIIR